ncbi:MAG: 3-methyl-2-oxobutanoate dehydrogenase subunit beta, partial [Pseudomonadota bacterium]
YYTPVLSPSTVQEFADMAPLAFEIAERYRTPVLILADGMLGQMMEPVVFPESYPPQRDPSDWALGCHKDRKENHIINTLFIDPNLLDSKTRILFEVYEEIKKNEVRFETYNLESRPKILVASTGTAARVVKSAIDALKEQGVEMGLFRPITLWPFPYDALHQAAAGVDKVITVELNMGQMEQDVRLALNGLCPTEFVGKAGGLVFTPEELADILRKKAS